MQLWQNVIAYETLAPCLALRLLTEHIHEIVVSAIEQRGKAVTAN